MTGLRALRVGDRAAVADLFARAADYVRLESGCEPGNDQVADFFDGAPPGCDPADGVRIGAGGDRLDGIAEMAFGYPQAGDAYVGLLLLDPAARGRGLGRAMVAALVDQARARGAGRMLVAVLDGNPRGRTFWEREGFVLEKTFEPQARGGRLHVIHRLTRAI